MPTFCEVTAGALSGTRRVPGAVGHLSTAFRREPADAPESGVDASCRTPRTSGWWHSTAVTSSGRDRVPFACLPGLGMGYGEG
jgi:hypothetical protein